MKKPIPKYIQDSFNHMVKDHADSGALNDLEFSEIQARSLEHLAALEECDNVEERDTIYKDIKSDQSHTARAIYNIVAATDHYLHARDLSAYRAKKLRAETSAQNEQSLANTIIIS